MILASSLTAESGVKAHRDRLVCVFSRVAHRLTDLETKKNMKATILTVLVGLGMLVGCAPSHHKIIDSVLADTLLTHRYELLRGDYSVVYSAETGVVSAGESIEVKIVLTNIGEQAILAPVPLRRFVTLHYSHVPGGADSNDRISIPLEGESNDLQAARRLEPGGTLVDTLPFRVPQSAIGTLRIVPSLQAKGHRAILVLRIRAPAILQSRHPNLGAVLMF